jgi:hypothetical protein
MEKTGKSEPSEFLAARRKAIRDKAIERRKTLARARMHQQKTGTPLPSFRRSVPHPPAP